MKVEGVMEETRCAASPEKEPAANRVSDANDKRLRELYELAREQKSD
jgi:hypothetical protein